MDGRPDRVAARLRLREMNVDDGAELVRLRRHAIASIGGKHFSSEDARNGPGDLQPELRPEAKPGETCVIGEVEGRMAGFVRLHLNGTTGEITDLYVDPALQRRGIGRRLAERAEGILRGRGAERVRLWANLGSAAACGALGYAESARRSDLTKDGLASATIEMEKPLDGDWRNFYGRRHGKTLRPAQRIALQKLADLSPGPVDRQANPERRPLELSRFGGRPLWLEIGFGGGEHLVHQASSNPGVQLIGAEPFINGVAMLLAKIASAGVSNISVHPGDVRDLTEVLPEASIARVFLLYPDPWPKRRHHRRRFVTGEHLAPLARVMAPGAEFRIATDVPDYVRQAREEVPRHGFEQTTTDITAPWPDWTRTRYEAKAIREGRRPHYLSYCRV